MSYLAAHINACEFCHGVCASHGPAAVCHWGEGRVELNGSTSFWYLISNVTIFHQKNGYIAYMASFSSSSAKIPEADPRRAMVDTLLAARLEELGPDHASSSKLEFLLKLQQNPIETIQEYTVIVLTHDSLPSPGSNNISCRMRP